MKAKTCSVDFFFRTYIPRTVSLRPSALQLIMQVLHRLVDGVYLPVRPPRHSELATESFDHLNMTKQRKE